jgi:hypothetical protein
MKFILEISKIKSKVNFHPFGIVAFRYMKLNFDYNRFWRFNWISDLERGSEIIV